MVLGLGRWRNTGEEWDQENQELMNEGAENEGEGEGGAWDDERERRCTRMLGMWEGHRALLRFDGR